MPFHRFENLQVHHLNPHLSTGEGPVIEGDFSPHTRPYSDISHDSQTRAIFVVPSLPRTPRVPGERLVAYVAKFR